MSAAAVLSLYWLLALGALGVFFPFYSLYLAENAGLASSRVGAVMAVIPLVGIAAQPAWGMLADRSGSRTRVLTTVTFGATAGYALLYFAHDFASLLSATALLALFSSALVSGSVAVSFALLSDRGPKAFGLVRVWGTVGYLITVVAVPALLGHSDGPDLLSSSTGVSQPKLGVIFPIAAALTGAAGLISLLLPSRGAVAARAAQHDWRMLLRQPGFASVLAFMFASYLFLHGPMVFFPVYVRSLGRSLETISRMWIVMLLLEIPLVALSGAGFQRLGGRALLGIGAGSGAVRWLVCGFSDELWLIYAVQVLHGVMVATLIVGAAFYVEAVVPDRLRSTAQGMLSMVSVSLGGIASSLLAGAVIDAFGPVALARLAGFGALALTLAVPVLIPAARRSGDTAAWGGDTIGTEPF
jgi:PPP family 3-phenylpropionic acid transporter